MISNPLQRSIQIFAIWAVCSLLSAQAQPYSDTYEHPDPNAPPEPEHIKELFHGVDASEEANLAFSTLAAAGIADLIAPTKAPILQSVTRRDRRRSCGEESPRGTSGSEGT